MSEGTIQASEIGCHSLVLQFADGKRAVNGVDATMPAASIVSLLGPSGCGKTTLLRLIAGLEHPTSGHVTLNPPVSKNAGEIAFVFQQPSLLPWRTALENVMLPLELIGGMTSSTQQEVAMQLLEDVGLQDAHRKLPLELSGGMRMRVSIARALVTSPRVLLLDEPFAALDDMLRHQLGQLLLQLWEQRRFTAVMVTHNIAEAILLSHQVLVMRQGKITSTLRNPLPMPRDEQLRRTSQFGEFYGAVSDRLRNGE